MEEYRSEEELFLKLRCVLDARIQELKKQLCPIISVTDIWDYLKIFKWSKGYNLALSDIVNDIFSCDPYTIYLNISSKRKHTTKDTRSKIKDLL